MLMLGAHERILLKQSVIRGILLRQFPLVCGGLYASNLSFVTKSKMSAAFDIFVIRGTLLSACGYESIFLSDRTISSIGERTF